MILSIKQSTEQGTHHCKSQGRELESNKENRLIVGPLECVSTHLNAVQIHAKQTCDVETTSLDVI